MAYKVYSNPYARRKRRRLLLLAAGVLIVLLAAALVILHARRRPQLSRSVAGRMWRSYRDAYQTWFGGFAEVLRTSEKARLTSGTPSSARRQLQAMAAALHDTGPLSLNSILGTDAAALTLAEQAQYVTGHGEVQQRLVHAVQTVRAVEAHLARLKAVLVDGQKRLTRQGLPALAKVIQLQIAARLRPDSTFRPARLARLAGLGGQALTQAQLHAWIHQIAVVSQIERQWAAVVRRQLAPKERGGTLLRQFKATAAAEAAQPLAGLAKPNGRDLHAALAAVQARIKVLAPAEQTLVTTLTRHQTDIDWKALAAAQPPPTCAQYLSWLPGYFYLRPDPYPAAKKWLAGRKARLRRRIAQIPTQAAASPPSTARHTASAQARAYQQQLAALVASLPATESRLPPIVRETKAIDAAIAALHRNVGGLTKQVQLELAKFFDPSTWTRHLLAGLHITPLSAINSAYAHGICRLLGASWPGPMTYQRLRNHVHTDAGPSYKSKLKTLRGRLLRIERQFAAGLPAGAVSPWNESIEHKILSPDRQRLLAAACRDLRWPARPGYLPALRAKYRRRWNAERQALARLAANFQRIHQLLAQAYLLHETAADGASIASLYRAVPERWRDDARVRRIDDWGLLMDRVRLLRRLARPGWSAASVANLAAALKPSPSPAVLRALWQRLGKLEPLTAPTALAMERALPAELQRQFKNIAPASRGRALEALLRRQALARWQMRFNAITQPARVSAAIDQARAFLIPVRFIAPPALMPRLNAPARYNLLLWKFLARARILLAHQPSSQQVQHLAKLFQTRIQRLKLPPLPAVERLQHRLTEVITPPPTIHGGPLRAGWTLSAKSAHARRITFVSPDGRRRLTFVRIAPTPNTRAFYLCTTAVSVDLFRTIVNTAVNIRHTPQRRAMERLLKDIAPRLSNFSGPHAWAFPSTAGIIVTSHWLTFPSAGVQQYAPELSGSVAGPGTTGYFTPPANELSAQYGGAPQGTDPMNYISPAAAMYAAALLGCRLPTVAEWQAAYRQYVRRRVWSTKNPEGWRPHLRGATWRIQYEYVHRLHAQGGSAPPWPDKDTYFYHQAGRPFSHAEIARWRACSDEAYGQSDLWFCPVGDDGAGWHGTPLAVHNLVGNVAEYVFTGSGGAAQPPPGSAVRTPQAVQEWLKLHGAADLRVIGGSCLAPTGNGKNGAPPPPTQPVSVNWARAMHHGFSDVGFRLAFGAAPRQPAAVLASILKESWYVANAP